MKEIFVNSHIQTPRSILLNFSKSGLLFYYDICLDRIRKGNTNLNSEYGFFSCEVEDILSKEIETPLGRIVKYATSNDFEKCVSAPKDVIEASKKYLRGIASRFVARNKIVTPTDGMHAWLAPAYLQHDVLFKSVFENENNMELFNNVFPTFLVNKTDVPLVLPICGIYEFDKIIISPITPWRAIVWVNDSSVVNKLISGNTSKVFLVSKTEDIIQMNIRAFSYECEYNKRYVVSQDKKILQNLLNEYRNT